MECTICKRRKKMTQNVINAKSGIYYKACGQFLKQKDKIFYNRWENMRYRTTSDNYDHYEYYKGKGINSDEFKYFIDFYDALYESFLEHAKIYGKNNTSLERIDISKSYTKENCTWVTLAEQKGNTSRTKTFKAIDPEGNIYLSKNVTKFCKEHNLVRSTLSDKLNKKNKSSFYKGWYFTYDIE